MANPESSNSGSDRKESRRENRRNRKMEKAIGKEGLKNPELLKNPVDGFEAEKEALQAEVTQKTVEEAKTNAEATKLAQEQAEERLDLRKVHAERSAEGIKGYSLAFLKAEEEYLNGKTAQEIDVEDRSFVVDFTNPETGAINKTAENLVTLGRIMLETKTDKVRVITKGGKEIDAYVWSNGRAYTVPEHDRDKTGIKYVAIYNGDKIIFPAKTEVSVASAQDKTKELLETEARNQADKLRMAKEARSQGQLTELWTSLEENPNPKITIPAGLRSYSPRDWEQNLPDMNMGAEIVSNLTTLSQIEGAGKSPVQMWESIRRANGGKNNLSFREISKVVLNERSGNTIEDYDELKKSQKVLDSVIAMLEKNPLMSTAEIRESLQNSSPNNDPDADTVRLYTLMTKENTYEHLTDGPLFSKEELLERKAESLIEASRYEKVFIATQNLMEAVDPNSFKALENAETERSYSKSEEVILFERSLNTIFTLGDVPQVKRKLLDKLFRPGRTSAEANMQNPGEKVKYDEAFERVFSADMANTRLFNSLVSLEKKADGTFEYKIDTQEAVSELNRLRVQGLQLEQGMSLDAPIDSGAITNLNNLSPEQIEHIRLGMVAEVKAEVAIDKARLFNEVISSYGGMTRELLEKMVAEYPDMPLDAFKEYGAEINKQMYGVIGLAYDRYETYKTRPNGTEKLQNVEELFGGSLSVPIKIGKDAVLVPTISANVFKAEVRFTPTVSKTWTLGKKERTTATVHAGPSLGEGGNYLSAAVSVEHTFDKDRIWSVGVDGGFGTNLNFDSLSLAFVGVKLGRDLEAVGAKNGRALWKAREGVMESASQTLMEEMKSLKGATNEAKEAFVKEVMEFYAEQVKEDSTDMMKDVQFTGLRVTLTASGIPVISGLVAIKGKKYLMYSTDGITNLDETALSKLKEAVNSQDAELRSVTISPEMNLGKGERLTYERKGEFDPWSAQENVSGYLKSHGLDLTKNSMGSFTLNVFKVNGAVKVYGDASAGINLESKNGQIQFNIPPTSRLSVNRVDTYTALPNGGRTQVTEIYLSNNENKSLEAIKASNNEHIFAKISDRGGLNTVAESVKHGFEYEMEGPNKWDIQSVIDAQKSLDTALGATRLNSISSERKAEIKAQVAELVASGKLKIDFAKNTDPDDYNQELLNAFNSLEPAPITKAEKLYVIQEMLTQTRAKAPENLDKFIEHVVDWNAHSLEQSLVKDGVEAGQAKTVALKIMSYYGRELRLNILKGETPTQETLEKGMLVRTHIGLAGSRTAGGNIMEFLNSSGNDEVALFKKEEMNFAVMQNQFGLSEAEATAFLGSQGLENLEQISTQPVRVLEHPVVVALLSNAGGIFGPEATNIFAEMAKNPQGIDINDSNYHNLIGVAITLLRDGAVSHNGRVLTLEKTAYMGFIDACKNFTTAVKAEIKIGASGAQVNLTQGVSAETGRNWHEFGVAGAVRVRRETIPPKPEDNPPRPLPRPDEKEPFGDLGEARDDLSYGGFDETGGAGAGGASSGDADTGVMQ